MFNFNWFKRNQREKEWERFRNWYQMHRLAEQVTFMRCHFCANPANSPEANYCSHCGACFHTEPGLLHTTTEPLPVERPSETLRRQLEERRQTRQLQQQQDTADVPTCKFRTVRLDRIV